MLLAHRWKEREQPRRWSGSKARWKVSMLRTGDGIERRRTFGEELAILLFDKRQPHPPIAEATPVGARSISIGSIVRPAAGIASGWPPGPGIMRHRSVRRESRCSSGRNPAPERHGDSGCGYRFFDRTDATPSRNAGFSERMAPDAVRTDADSGDDDAMEILASKVHLQRDKISRIDRFSPRFRCRDRVRWQVPVYPPGRLRYADAFGSPSSGSRSWA